MDISLVILLAAMATPPEQPTAAKPAEKMICKRIYDAETGSNMRSSKRVCGTAVEWELRDDEIRRLAQAQRGRGAVNRTNPGMGAPQ